METIEQAQERLEVTMDGKNGFFRGVLWSQRWIPVEEELPEYKLIVLCTNSFSAFVAVYCGEQDGFRIPNVIGEQVVTHWRPIEHK